MAIYRGTGGAGDATNDATVTEVTQQAVNAAASATEAAASATTASTKASEASTSATTASTKASEASTSATNAATSATEAETAKTAAETAQTAAETAQTAAETAETNAETAQTAAETAETNAATSETNAAASATSASTSASTATTKASEAATSATNAATSATNASTSATAAQTAQTAAETAQAAAEAAQEAIDGLYLGTNTTNPTVDLNGDAVTAGDWYFNTTDNVTRIYDGTNWNTLSPDLSGDASPQLGGNLDLNSNDITGTGDINITGSVSITGTVDGRDVATDGSKLDGIEAGADVTDTDNVTAAGALMDSEVTNLAQVKAFDSSDYATAAQGTTADSAMQDLVDDTTPQLGGNLDTNGNNVNFGDNDKAQFGAGNDLQIYHDGSNSYIKDAGTGNLLIQGADQVNIGGANGTIGVQIVQGSSTTLRHNNSPKLATASTGVNVTGTVTADGLTVDTDTLHVDATNNRVGVGTSSPSQALDISGGSIKLDDSQELRFGTSSVASVTGVDGASGYLSFATNGVANRMRIDSSGNVGIGTTSPALGLDVVAPTGKRNSARFTPNGSPNGQYIGITTCHANPNGAGAGWETGAIGVNIADGFDATTNKPKINNTYGGWDAGAAITLSPNDGSIQFYNADGGSAGTVLSERMRIDSSGKVGIGTSSPSEGIHLSRSNATALIESTDGTQATLDLKNTEGHYILGSDGGSLFVYDQTGSSEKLRILSSGGITFNGDTAAANALDDYEEGTWTPGFGGTRALTGGTNSFRYVKVGKQVTVYFSLINATWSGSASGSSLTGLPFTNHGTTRAVGAVQFRNINLNDSTFNFTAVVAENNNYVFFPQQRDNSTWLTLSMADLTAGDYLAFTVTYEVA